MTQNPKKFSIWNFKVNILERFNILLSRKPKESRLVGFTKTHQSQPWSFYIFSFELFDFLSFFFLTIISSFSRSIILCIIFLLRITSWSLNRVNNSSRSRSALNIPIGIWKKEKIVIWPASVIANYVIKIPSDDPCKYDVKDLSNHLMHDWGWLEMKCYCNKSFSWFE